MALIKCPECGNTISDKAEKCPQCGLPAEYFHAQISVPQDEIDYSSLANNLISFDLDYARVFSRNRFITHKDALHLRELYGSYYVQLNDSLVLQYIENHAGQFHLDFDNLMHFMRKMQTLETDITTHNRAYIDRTVTEERKNIAAKTLWNKATEQYFPKVTRLNDNETVLSFCTA